MQIGFLGLGDMGQPMARRVLANGHRLVVWNRDPAKMEALVAQGAEPASSPAALMDRVDIVGLCVTSDRAVEAIAFGPEGLFSAAATEGKAVADFSTGSADAARSFAERAAQQGADWVDAPVSGGVPAAVAGSLIVMAGGDAGAIARLEPLLSAVSQRVSHLGPSGCGQLMKLCNQMIVSCNVLVMAETIALARKAGIDVSRFADTLKGGFADSVPLQIFGPRMAAHRFEPRQTAIGLMKKDAGLAAQLAEEFGMDTPMLQRAVELYARGDIDADADVSRLIALHESLDR